MPLPDLKPEDLDRIIAALLLLQAAANESGQFVESDKTRDLMDRITNSREA